MFSDQPYLTRIREIVIAGLADIPCAVYLFGSRAEGTHAPISDVDIAVLAEKDISRQLSRIRERLEDSTIPLVVDLVDLRNTTPDFLRQVQTQGIVIWKN